MATKPKLKPTATDIPFVEGLKPEAASTESIFDDWKRKLAGGVLTVITSAGLGYMAGTLLGYIVVAAALLSGSMFIAQLIYILGMLAIFYAGYRIGPLVYLSVVDRKVDDAFDAVRGWFTSAPKGVAA